MEMADINEEEDEEEGEEDEEKVPMFGITSNTNLIEVLVRCTECQSYT